MSWPILCLLPARATACYGSSDLHRETAGKLEASGAALPIKYSCRLCHNFAAADLHARCRWACCLPAVHSPCLAISPGHEHAQVVLCRYFEGLFPQLCLACFAFGLRHCATDPAMQQYFPDGLRSYPFADGILGSSPSRHARLVHMVRHEAACCQAVKQRADVHDSLNRLSQLCKGRAWLAAVLRAHAQR